MNMCSLIPRKGRSILFLIRSLGRGGAERQIVGLAKGLLNCGYSVTVCSFFTGGVFERQLSSDKIRVISLNKRKRWNVFPFIFNLLKLIRSERPDFIHSYLTVANILAAFLRPFFLGSRLVWGVRCSSLDLKKYDVVTRFSCIFEGILSFVPDLVISNSYVGTVDAIRRGFTRANMVTIPNGIDCEYFNRRSVERERVRCEWEIGDQQFLIGVIARLDPMKDQMTFLRAASLIVDVLPNARFVLVGEGNDEYAVRLARAVDDFGLSEVLTLVGPRDDMPAVYSALDVVVSSSAFGEGFSNTVAEAMACCVPCVVTDVGDSAAIVDGLGKIVRPGDAPALALAVVEIARLSVVERRELGDFARERISCGFSVEKLLVRTVAALERLF